MSVITERLGVKLPRIALPEGFSLARMLGKISKHAAPAWGSVKLWVGISWLWIKENKRVVKFALFSQLISIGVCILAYSAGDTYGLHNNDFVLLMEQYKRYPFAIPILIVAGIAVWEWCKSVFKVWPWYLVGCISYLVLVVMWFAIGTLRYLDGPHYTYASVFQLMFASVSVVSMGWMIYLVYLTNKK